MSADKVNVPEEEEYSEVARGYGEPRALGYMLSSGREGCTRGIFIVAVETGRMPETVSTCYGWDAGSERAQAKHIGCCPKECLLCEMECLHSRIWYEECK